jgi:cytochrome c peroxidase
MKSEKAAIEKRQADLLVERYDLSDKPAPGVTMSRGKPVQQGVRAKLTAGVTWQSLAEMTPEQIREKNAWPAGFLPLPHPNHPEGGMVFPKFHIEKSRNRSSAT